MVEKKTICARTYSGQPDSRTIKEGRWGGGIPKTGRRKRRKTAVPGVLSPELFLRGKKRDGRRNAGGVLGASEQRALVFASFSQTVLGCGKTPGGGD